VCVRICGSQNEWDDLFARLKITACPHCKRVGTLIRHGVLRGYEEGNVRHTTVRAQRVFCSNRNRADGCGRTFSVWMADKVKRLFLNADSLWLFLKQAADTNNKINAFRKTGSSMSDSAPYRIWKRFLKAQTAIRTALSALCPPTKTTSEDAAQHASALPTQSTIDHLKDAFKGNALNPVAAFQAALQTFFI
jgi:hypothetical protein